MRFELRQAGPALVIEILEPRLDAAVAIRFKEVVRDAMTHEGTPVILDLTQVAFLDSSGLGAIVGTMKLLGANRPLQIAGLSASVRKVFRLTRMDTVFTIHDQMPDSRPISATG